MRLLSATLTGVAAVPLASQAIAAGIDVSVEIPRLNVAEYHRPYVSMWIERADQSPVTTLAVWYDIKLRDKEGTKWLKDMRQWWRKAGRDMQMPADGISGATRAPGTHAVKFVAGKSPMGTLPAGDYQLVVEAAREVGGRELVRLPFAWPPAGTGKAQAKGEHELGAVTLTARP